MASRKKKKKAPSKKTRQKGSRRSGSHSEPTPARTAAPPAPQATAVRSARPRTPSLLEVFESLAGILVPYARLFESEMHPRMGYCLKAKYGERPTKELYFGGVRLHQDHVSYHLFLLYSYPDLEEGLSPELRQRQQGKTCFLLERDDAALCAELEALTRACFERFRTEGLYGRTG